MATHDPDATLAAVVTPPTYARPEAERTLAAQ